MKRFYQGVINHSKTIIFCFIAAFLAALICKPLISVNYDINDYLPEESASTIALDTMNAEYEGGIPNARVMVHDVSVPKALEYKAKLLQVEGVTDVTWMDDITNITQPIEFMDPDMVETYYKDGNALFSVTILEDKSIEAVESIRGIIGSDNAMTGSVISSVVATTSTVTEVPIIAIFAVLFTLIVLTLTTTSWAEPFIVLAGLGMAVIINSGSNIIFGEISFVTNAAGSILQLAVSLDYSIFLLHRFVEYSKQTDSTKEAMVNALCSSTTSILSSGLTTVIGFLALCMMRFKIGPDLGIALAKGVALSLITVFFFMPVFILATYKLIEKTQHRSFLPSFQRFGKMVCRLMIPFVLIFVILLVPSYLASGSNQFNYGASRIFGMETQLGKDTAKIEDAFGKDDTYVLLLPKESTATQKALSDELRTMPQVKSILSYVDTVGSEIPEQYLDTDTLSKLNSQDYTRMSITVETDFEGEETFALVENIRETAEKFYPDNWLLAGQGVSTLDLKDTITNDTMKVNLLAIGAVFFVLLLTMKSVSLPVILVLGIETAIWINFSIPYFTDQYIFYIAYLIVSSVQLGATVDYAILFTDRYREFRQQMGRKKAIISTISSSTVSIMTSASVLTVVGFLLGMVSTHGLLAQLGLFLGKGTLCSLVVVLFVLPGLLYLFDGLIQKTTLGTNFIKSNQEDIL